jgi:tetratricopeptide (TPR) repeat protein
MVDVSLKKKAHDLVQKGKLDSALRVFNLLLEEDPEDASVHNSIGDILLKLKRNDEALEHFALSAEHYFLDGLHMVSLSVSRKALRIDPDFGRATYIIARCFQAQDKAAQAKTHYIEFLRTKPAKTDPAVLESCYSLTSLDPENSRWVKRLARLAYIQKKIGYLDRCVSLAAERNMPEHAKIVRMLEEMRFSRTDDDSEIPEGSPAEKAEAVTEEHVPEAAEPSEEYVEEKTEATDEEYREEEEPGGEEQYDELDTASAEELPPGAEDFVYVGQETEFEEPKRSALDDVIFEEDDFIGDITEDVESPEIERKRQRLGEYFVANGMLKATDVLKALEQQTVAEKGVRLGDVLVEMGLVSSRQVREALSKQVADMRSRLADDPDDALGYVEMANLLLDVGDFYGSVGAYLKAADIYRSMERDVMVFELLEGVLDICPESLTAAKELVRIRMTMTEEGQARALYRIAVAYLLNDSPFEAMAALEASIKTNPDYKMAASLLAGIKPSYRDKANVANIASILDDIDSMFDNDSAQALAEVIREFRDGIQENIAPEDFKTHYDLGIAYREMGLLREAASEFELILISPDHRLEAREMLGRCCFDMQRYDEAEDHFMKGMSIAGDNLEALIGFHLHLSKVYEDTGRKTHAKAELEAAIALDPVLAKIQGLE